MTQQPYGNEPQWGGPGGGQGGWGATPGPGTSSGWTGQGPAGGGWSGPSEYSALPPAGYPARGAYQPTDYPGVYPGYGPVGPTRPRRPGAATGAGVLSIVHGSWVLFTGILLLTGVSSVAQLTDSLGNPGFDAAAEFVVVAIATVVVGSLCLAGGIQLLGGRRTVLLWANALSLLLSVYWLIRTGFIPGFVWLPLLHSVLPIISLSLALSAGVTQWLPSRRGGGPTKV